MGDLATFQAIRYLKAFYWTPGKIRRLLDTAETAGRNPLAAAHDAALQEAFAVLRPAARRYATELHRGLGVREDHHGPA